MSLTKEKQDALLLIALAVIINAIASRYITVNDTGLGATAEGPGLFLSPFGIIFWVYGFMKYARAKGRSELLAIFLSFFLLPGFIILLLLKDLKKTKPSGSKK